MIVGFAGLFALSFFFPFAFVCFVSLAAIYFLVLFAGGILGAVKVKALRALFLIPLLLAVQHFTYGLGFLIGLIRWKVRA